MSESPLILYGGSFDPVHNGHLRIASYAYRRLKGDVHFLPAKSPRWKSASASSKDRFMMLQLAVASQEHPFFVSEMELEREGEVTYSIDTVKAIKEKEKERPLILLIGADQALRFHEWKEAKLLSRLAKIVVVPRPEQELATSNIENFKMEVLPYYGSGSVSSTKIREGKCLDLPEEVLIYMEAHELYFWGKVRQYCSNSRYEHSLSVAHLARQIAEYNRLDESLQLACYRAGVLHDIGKEITQEKSISLMKEIAPSYISLPSYAYHQYIGEYLAKKEFQEDDERVLSAIATHCTGSKGMGCVAKILYSADKIDPGRGWDSRIYIKECLKDYEKGFRKILAANREYLGKLEEEENALSKACYEEYLTKGDYNE